ncbi:MAG: hypothetical protein JSS09_01815 [Verrucomicrobia bacterium]|nr:hypothetical protein [Verrucomicrobiota bacterium]
MSISLNKGSGYDLSTWQSKLPCLFLSGATYSKRHWDLAFKDGLHAGHLFLACTEWIPVIGGSIALIEWLSHKKSKNIEKSPPNIQNQASLINNTVRSLLPSSNRLPEEQVRSNSIERTVSNFDSLKDLINSNLNGVYILIMEENNLDPTVKNEIIETLLKTVEEVNKHSKSCEGMNKKILSSLNKKILSDSRPEYFKPSRLTNDRILEVIQELLSQENSLKRKWPSVEIRNQILSALNLKTISITPPQEKLSIPTESPPSIENSEPLYNLIRNRTIITPDVIKTLQNSLIRNFQENRKDAFDNLSVFINFLIKNIDHPSIDARSRIKELEEKITEINSSQNSITIANNTVSLDCTPILETIRAQKSPNPTSAPTPDNPISIADGEQSDATISTQEQTYNNQESIENPTEANQEQSPLKKIVPTSPVASNFSNVNHQEQLKDFINNDSIYQLLTGFIGNDLISATLGESNNSLNIHLNAPTTNPAEYKKFIDDFIKKQNLFARGVLNLAFYGGSFWSPPAPVTIPNEIKMAKTTDGTITTLTFDSPIQSILGPLAGLFSITYPIDGDPNKATITVAYQNQDKTAWLSDSQKGLTVIL